MSMAPSVLIVHGSWHTPSFFTNVSNTLKSQGYETVVPWLPTCHLDAEDMELVDFYSDSAMIQKSLLQLIDQGKEVLVVAHSYGGAPATDAISDDLIRTKRRAMGKEGGVIGLLALASMLIMPGQSIEEAFGGVAPFVELHANGTITAKDPENIMFNDLNSEEQAKAVSMLVPSTRQAHTKKLRQSPYAELPIVYLLCEQDHAIPLALQKSMISSLDLNGALITSMEISSGHSPELSHPRSVVSAITRMIKALGF